MPIFPDDSPDWNAFGGITTIIEDGERLPLSRSDAPYRLSTR